MNSSNNIRTGLTAEEIRQAFRDNLRCTLGRLEAVATKHDIYFALALTVRDRLFERSVESMRSRLNFAKGVRANLDRYFAKR